MTLSIEMPSLLWATTTAGTACFPCRLFSYSPRLSPLRCFPYLAPLLSCGPQRKEMTETIKADLERLFPTGCGDHFLAPARQELLLSVLSLWADLNTATSYRQVQAVCFLEKGIYHRPHVCVLSLVAGVVGMHSSVSVSSVLSFLSSVV